MKTIRLCSAAFRRIHRGAGKTTLCLLAGTLLGAPAARAATSTWGNSNVSGATPPAALDWYAGGANTQGTWIGDLPRGTDGRDVVNFFEDVVTSLPNAGAAGNVQTSYVNYGGKTNWMGKLVFQGRGSATPGADLTLTVAGDPLEFGNGFSYSSYAIEVDGWNSRQSLSFIVDNDIILGHPSVTMALPLRCAGSATLTLNGTISEAKAPCVINKFGPGSITLGGANTFSGGLNVYGGTMRLAGPNTGTLANKLELFAGNTILDLAAGNDRWNTNSVFGLHGGTLTVQGAPSGISSQTLAGPSVNRGDSMIVIDPNGGAGTTLSLGDAWTMPYEGALLIDLSRPGATLVSSPPLVSEIIALQGKWGVARVLVKDAGGIDFGTVVGGQVARYTGAIPLQPSSSSYANCVAAGTTTMAAGSHNLYTLKLDATTQSGLLDLNGTTLSSVAGILMVGDEDFTIANGTLDSYWIRQHGGGTLTVSASLGGFSMAGPGRVALTAANTSTAEICLYNGVLQAEDGVGIPAGALLKIPGGVLESHGTMTRTTGLSAGNVSWTQVNGSWGGTGGGFAARGGTYTINLNAGAALTWPGAWNSGFVSDGQALVLGSDRADSLLDWQNAIDLNTTKRLLEIRVVDNPASETDIAQISGVLSGTAGGLLKTGDGTLRLTATNSYAGPTVVSGGTLLVNGALDSRTAIIQVEDGGTLGGSGIVGRPVFVADGGALLGGQGLTCEGNCTLEPGAVVRWDAGATGTVEVQGVLTLPAEASAEFGSLPPTGLVLFESANAIVGSPAAWTVTPSTVTLRVSADGKQVLACTGGSLILVR